MRGQKLLTVPQAAEQLEVTPRTVYRYIDDGALACVRLSGEGGPVRVRECDLDRFILDRLCPATVRALR